MIEGVQIIPLRQIADDRGKVMHMLRADSPYFNSFGEIYFSTVLPGVVKAWHFHKKMILNYAVPIGMIKLVLYDSREGSVTKGEVQEIFIGQDNYSLVIIPAMIWNGFQGIGEDAAYVANCSTIPHEPDEVDRLDPLSDHIHYDRNLKLG